VDSTGVGQRSPSHGPSGPGIFLAGLIAAPVLVTPTTGERIAQTVSANLPGMSDPAKVLNFLDVAGSWDPSLAFVLGGASTTAWPGFRLVGRRERPMVFDAFQMPTRADARRHRHAAGRRRSPAA